MLQVVKPVHHRSLVYNFISLPSPFLKVISFNHLHRCYGVLVVESMLLLWSAVGKTHHMFCGRTCDELYQWWTIQSTSHFHWSSWDTHGIPTDQVCPSQTTAAWSIKSKIFDKQTNKQKIILTTLPICEKQGKEVWLKILPTFFNLHESTVSYDIPPNKLHPCMHKVLKHISTNLCFFSENIRPRKYPFFSLTFAK